MPPIGIDSRELALLHILNEQGVRYLLIGGAAVRYYSPGRLFDDVDLLVDNSPPSTEQLHLVLCAAVENDLCFSAHDLEGPQKLVKLEPNGYRVDLLTSVQGFDFEELFVARGEVEESGVTIPVVAREHLVRLKRAAAERDQERAERELADVELLS